MPEVKWPRRTIRITPTSAGSQYFSVPDDGDRTAIGLYEEVLLSGGNKVYIQPGASAGVYALSETEYNGALRALPADNKLDKDVGVIVNYPSRPLLRDHGAQVNTSLYNPLRTNPYTISEGIYEGSIALDVYDVNDVPIVEAFIDQLASADSWFECPLPGNHLGALTTVGVETFITKDNVDRIRVEKTDSTLDIGDIFLDDSNTRLTDTINLHGYFARVDRRTCRIVSDRINAAGEHIINIVPPLISRATDPNNTNDPMKFSEKRTCRVRPTSVSSTGTADFEASWIINWVETLGLDENE